MIIANENSIYIYYEVIKQLEPKRVLDAGMFLKRIGSVSRCAMECQVPEEVRLDGIDFFLEADMPVWRKIYDEVVEYKSFLEKPFVKKYDLAVLLGSDELQIKADMEMLVHKLKHSAHYLLTDDILLIQPFIEDKRKVHELKVEDSIYYLLDCTDLDDRRIAFIICQNNETFFDECSYYINKLNVPEGYSVEVCSIGDAKSMCSAYNEGMRSSKAKYKIYMHQDVFIRNEYFLHHIIEIFQKDENIGMLGMMGGTQMPETGVAYRAWNVGLVDCRDADMSYYLLSREQIKQDVLVEAIDGLLMATQYDLPWREDLFHNFDFYDVSQSFEMRKAGYKIVVPYQEEPWVIHDSSFAKLNHYDINRRICIKEYPEFFYADNGFEFTYNEEWDLLSSELSGQVKRLMEHGEWETVAAIISQYRMTGRKDSVLEMLAVMTDIVQKENEAGELHPFFEGISVWQLMYEKYMRMRFLLRRMELKMPETAYEELVSAIKENQISYSALLVLLVHSIVDKKACMEQLIKLYQDSGQIQNADNLKRIYVAIKDREIPYAFTKSKE